MRVLVLEDDGDIRSAVARFLASSGYSVDQARGWSEAEEKLSINDYDAMVLDRSVPGGDSIDLLRQRRSEGDSTPALFLTGKDSIGDRVEGLSAGADDYLVKPFAMDELVARVHVMARRTQAVVESTLRLADVELDPAKMSASRGGTDLSLTIKEFALLRYLLTHLGRIVSRPELIEHCWDEFAEPMSNVVDVKVAQLRKKLGSPSLVHTIRGAGYILSETAP